MIVAMVEGVEGGSVRERLDEILVKEILIWNEGIVSSLIGWRLSVDEL